MFIQTQSTPNPNSLMFMPGQEVMESGSHEFPNARAGMASPLAKRLFSIDGVSAALFGSNFITVTKQEDFGWAVLKPQVFAAVMDHFSSGQPLFTEGEAVSRDDTAIHPDDSEVVQMIKELLETRIRPSVQDDGGDISYRSYNEDTGQVEVKMHGACRGCASSAVTLKSGIEAMLMHYIPEVKGVEAVEDEDEIEGLKEFNKLESSLGDTDEESAANQAKVANAKESPMASHLSN